MSKQSKPITPPLTDEAFEKSLKASALRQAQKELDEGKATSQTINAILSMNARKEQLQLEELELRNELTRAKIEETKAAGRIEELVEGVHEALKRYSGAY